MIKYCWLFSLLSLKRGEVVDLGLLWVTYNLPELFKSMFHCNFFSYLWSLQLLIWGREERMANRASIATERISRYKSVFVSTSFLRLCSNISEGNLFSLFCVSVEGWLGGGGRGGYGFLGWFFPLYLPVYYKCCESGAEPWELKTFTSARFSIYLLCWNRPKHWVTASQFRIRMLGLRGRKGNGLQVHKGEKWGTGRFSNKTVLSSSCRLKSG